MNLLPLCMTLVLGAAMAASAQELPADPVDPAAPAAADAPARVDPKVAAENVSEALEDAKGVPAKDITVATHASTIVISGTVDTEAERVATLGVAQRAAGGVRTSSDIEVRPLQDRSPKEQLAIQQSSQLVRDVQAALKADARTANLGVAVTSADANSVVLQGLVASRESRTAVQSVVAKVKGVTRIDNRLLTPGDPIPAARP